MHRLPFDAQFICIRACHETASVAILGDAVFAQTMLGRLFTAAHSLQPGQSVEDSDIDKWNSLRDNPPSGRLTYTYLRGLRVTALQERPPVAYSRTSSWYQRFLMDGLLEPDGTPIAAYRAGHLAFNDDYPGDCLAVCMDRTMHASIDPLGILDIHATSFALRHTRDWVIGPHIEGHQQVMSLRFGIYAPRNDQVLTAGELLEGGNAAAGKSAGESPRRTR